MIELNLLPELKQTFIKAQRTRRLVISLSILISAGVVVLLVILLSVNGLQKKHLSDLSSDISRQSSTLKNEPQINKILTVQNQLGSLTALHEAKPEASKLFGYLNQITPAEVSIGNFSIDFTQQLVTVSGTAPALSSVNKYIDTLKFTTYTTASSNTSQPAFSNIVLSSFSVNGNAKDASAATNYSLTLGYDKNIFDITQEAKLAVPTTTTTRTGLDNSSDLFKAAPTTTKTTTKGTP